MILESKYKRVPAKEPGCCTGCILWEDKSLAPMCIKYGAICLEKKTHKYNFIEISLPILPINIKIL